MKSFLLFLNGTVLGVVLILVVTHRYDVQVAVSTGVPIIIKVDRWTGKIATEFAIPEANAKK